MNARSTRQPVLEQLEARWCPAFSLIALDAAGNLVVSGTPTSDTITFNFTADDQVQVLDDVTSLGSFNVPGNLRINLGNKILNNGNSGLVVSLDMNGFSLSGSVAMTLGNVINSGGGQSGFAIDDGDLGGTISGNLTITSGSGDDSLSLVSGTTIQGNLSFAAGAGSDGVDLGAVNVGGNVVTSKVNTFMLEAGQIPSNVDGNVILNAGGENASNTYFFFGTTSVRSRVGGSVIITTGNGIIDTALFQGEIDGNLLANMGSGFNDFILDSSALVLRSMAYTGGNGTDIVNLASTAGGTGAAVMGNATMVGGNGSNQFLIDANTFIGGSSINYIGGNNADLLEFAGNAPGARLNANLGAGVDEFDVGSNTLASAFIDFGAGLDKLVQTNGLTTIAFPLTLRNLP